MEDRDGMILSCDIAQILWPTTRKSQRYAKACAHGAHYFSTHGWSLVVSFGGRAFEDEPLVAAACFRALRSKKLAITADRKTLQDGKSVRVFVLRPECS